MRKVLLLVLVLIGGYSYGQVYQQMSQYGVEFKRMDNDSVLRIPRGLGSLRSISGYDTAQIRYNVSDSSVYVHTGNGWIKVVRATGADADSSVFATVHKLYTTIDSLGNLIISENLGNTNLTQSDAIRTYDGDGGELSFSNLGKFKVSASDSAIIKSSNIYGTATNSFVIDSIGGMQLRKYGPDAVVTIVLDENNAILNSENIDDTSTLIVAHSGISMTSSNYISLTADSILITNTPPTLTTDYDVLVRDENTGKVGIATISGGADSTIFSTNYRRDTAIANVRSQLPLAANPSASIGLTAVNGSATTFMRSDAAPALSQSIAPTWTGLHTFNPTLNASGGVGRSLLVNGTISATANGDKLFGLDVKPSLSAGAFTGMTLGGARIASGSAGASDAILSLENNSGNEIFKFRNNGQLIISSSTGTNPYTLGNSSGGALFTLNALTAGFGGVVSSVNSTTVTSGDNAALSTSTANSGFAPTSGTASYTFLRLYGTINQTGTASGAIRGIYYNPTLTSVLGTHTAYESTTGNTLIGTTSGSVGIGANTSINASAILDITSTSKGVLLPRMTGIQAEAISSPADGLLIYCNNGNGSTINSTGFWGYTGGWVKLN